MASHRSSHNSPTHFCLGLLHTQLLRDKFQSLHVEGNHAQRNAGLVVLELFFEFYGKLVFSGKLVGVAQVPPAIEKLHIA